MTTLEERAAARRDWPLRRIDLADEGKADDLRLVSTAIERLAMVVQLTEDCFPSVPSYPRSEAPGRVIRPPR